MATVSVKSGFVEGFLRPLLAKLIPAFAAGEMSDPESCRRLPLFSFAVLWRGDHSVAGATELGFQRTRFIDALKVAQQ